MEARVYAEQRQIRLIGVDRPGIGSSTPYQYDTVFAFADDLRTIADTLGIDKMEVIGLSGGGPYTLACAAAMPDRVVAAGVIGGVAPTTGSDGIAGGVMGSVGLRLAPLLQVAGGPIGMVASALIRLIRPVGSPAVDLYGRVSPEADRRLLARPEIKAMFLDDLLNGRRKQMAAPFADVVVFARDWGFRLDEVKVPVRWWHGDHDHIVPFNHGLHVVAKLPDVELYHLPGESHLAGLGRAEEILGTMIGLWDRCDQT
jgi:pimeloyl-ACP methyl ester carboxylesterase